MGATAETLIFTNYTNLLLISFTYESV